MINLQQLGGAWEAVVDFLLPRLCCSCGDRIPQSRWLVCEPCLDSIPPVRLPICSTCGCPDAVFKSAGRCTNCPAGTIAFERARGAANYEGLAQVLVEKLKYNGRLEYAPLMALAMAKCHEEHRPALPPDLIIPVPLHSTRRRERGFNQALVLAQELSAICQIPVEESVLRRDRPVPSQTRLKKRDRRRNVQGAFSCSNVEEIRDKTILLIDDVYTTGSTLNECAKTLTEAGSGNVQCLAYARAVLR